VLKCIDTLDQKQFVPFDGAGEANRYNISLKNFMKKYENKFDMMTVRHLSYLSEACIAIEELMKSKLR
jgi:hypothetical protein